MRPLNTHRPRADASPDGSRHAVTLQLPVAANPSKPRHRR
jgi:hypothetical protein